jgi:hypothetical protein
MNVELIEKFLRDKYGTLSLVKKQDGYKLDDLFIYQNKNNELRWYVDIETDLYAWFGPGNYYNIIHNWFFKQFGKEIGYDK